MWAILAAALLAVNACASAGTGASGPLSQQQVWPVYLGSDLRAPAAAPAGADSVDPAPRPVWRRDLGRGIVGAPALTEDLVAVSQVDRRVALLDRATGAVIWERRLGANLGSGPLADFDRLYVATQTDLGEVAALALQNGRTLWRERLGDVVAPLAQKSDRLVAAATDGWVTALSSSTGSRLWRRQLSGAVRAAPVLTGSSVLVATAEDSLYRLDGATGAVLARRGTEGAILAAPALADSLLVFGTSAGRLEACDTATLATRWALRAGGALVGSVAVRADTAWAITAAGELWSVPLSTPGGARHVALGVVSRAGPTPVPGGVLVASTDGAVILVDAATGERRWSAQLRPPVIEPVLVSRGLLIAVSERGEVEAWR